MIRRCARVHLALATLALGLSVVAAAPAAAADAPRLAAKHRGSGTFENRGTKEVQSLSEARVILGERGAATIEVAGKNVRIAMRGRVTEFNGRKHVNFRLETFDGVPTDAAGWLELDQRGGFGRLEIDGQSPQRLGISFTSQGANLEPAPPPPPAPDPAPAGFSEESGIDRRGADYRSFPVDDLRSCQNACKGDTRCRAYAYHHERRVCSLKSQVPEASRDRNVTSGVRQGWGGSGGSGGSGGGSGGSGGGSGRVDVTEERGFDRRGNDYADFRARDLFDCQESCRRDERCQAYSYDVPERICWLKDRVPSQQRNRDRVTGYKQR